MTSIPPPSDDTPNREHEHHGDTSSRDNGQRTTPADGTAVLSDTADAIVRAAQSTTAFASVLESLGRRYDRTPPSSHRRTLEVIEREAGDAGSVLHELRRALAEIRRRLP